MIVAYDRTCPLISTLSKIKNSAFLFAKRDMDVIRLLINWILDLRFWINLSL